MLTISFKSGTTLARKLAKKGPLIIEVLMTRANALMFQLQSYIKSQKLSGQVLQRRTGILSESVRAIPATLEGKTITFGVEAAGGAALYGAVQEKGGKRAYQVVAVNARALSFIMDGRRVFAKSVIHPPLPARPFMRPSLEENQEMIEADLQAALNEAMNE